MKLEARLPFLVLKGLERGAYDKDTFWASETETPVYDLYHKWMGTPPTNPPNMFSLWRMELGNAVEQAVLTGLKDEILEPQKVNDLVDWNEEKEQFYFRTKLNGLPVSGAIDAILKDGSPLEIKSYYGYYQTTEIIADKPRLSYLKQLAVYMTVLDQDAGYLYYAPLIEQGDKLETKPHKVFKLERHGESFRCGDIEFTLLPTLKRWQLAYELIEANEPPSAFLDGLCYKTPLDEINWRGLKKSEISKARNNRGVIGDWAVAYSPWKDKWVEEQKQTLGYTDSELATIKRATAGYTNWEEFKK